jgi:DNA-binding NtrC family response regulator
LLTAKKAIQNVWIPPFSKWHMKKNLILIVDDEPEIRKVIFEGLSRNGHSIFLAENAERALHLFGQKAFDLVVTDVKLPDRDGLELLDTIKSRSAHTPVIVMTGFGSIQNAVEAMRKGAFDYVLKPFSLESLEQRIQMALGGEHVHEEVHPDAEDFSNETMPILTKDKRMKEMIALSQRIAPSKATVLIQGESGTGKELFARYIHAQSPQKQGPFVAVNCASLPETLFESELFGYEKGAFTGALGKKIGKFELAHRGTILLDEISEMSPLLQAKILRVLQENEVDRIGGKEPIPVDIRVIATTNQDLETRIEKGDFREDLYYRLNVISIKLPPLRERQDDTELLAHYFIKKYSASYQKPILSISENAMVWLKNQPWRGNVRELKNMIERAILLTSNTTVDLKDLCEEDPNHAREFGLQEPLTLPLREMEKSLIFRALEKTNGNRTHAAKILGISIRTLRNKLHEYKQNLPSLEVT